MDAPVFCNQTTKKMKTAINIVSILPSDLSSRDLKTRAGRRKCAFSLVFLLTFQQGQSC